jgi:hypothetical protein
MKARRITAKLIATPEEHEALISFLEAERNRLIETGQGETPLGRALWASTDGIGAALEAHARRRSGLITLAQAKLK